MTEAQRWKERAVEYRDKVAELKALLPTPKQAKLIKDLAEHVLDKVDGCPEFNSEPIIELRKRAEEWLQ